MASPGTEISNPLSPRSSNSSLPVRVDEMDYSTEASSIGEEDYFQNGSSESTPTGSSPQQPYNPQTAAAHDTARSSGLHISVPDRDLETDDNSMQEGEMPMLDEDQQQAMFLDDEGLTALEKIYLFSRSTFSWHRSYISKQLPYLIRDVPPTEAVDYVCPLLNGLGTDPGEFTTGAYSETNIPAEEGVKEVFVQELVPIIWWFFTVRASHRQAFNHLNECLFTAMSIVRSSAPRTTAYGRRDTPPGRRIHAPYWLPSAICQP
jgi:hypothetical protein